MSANNDTVAGNICMSDFRIPCPFIPFTQSCEFGLANKMASLKMASSENNISIDVSCSYAETFYVSLPISGFSQMCLSAVANLMLHNPDTEYFSKDKVSVTIGASLLEYPTFFTVAAKLFCNKYS